MFLLELRRKTFTICFVRAGLTVLAIRALKDLPILGVFFQRIKCFKYENYFRKVQGFATFTGNSDIQDPTFPTSSHEKLGHISERRIIRTSPL